MLQIEAEGKGLSKACSHYHPQRADGAYKAGVSPSLPVSWLQPPVEPPSTMAITEHASSRHLRLGKRLRTLPATALSVCGSDHTRKTWQPDS